MKKLSRQEIVIIAITVTLIVIVGCVFLTIAGVQTDGFKHEFRYFYVTAGKTKYLQDADVVLGNAQFDVHYILKKNVGYTVKVLPAGDNVIYRTDGGWLSYTSEVKDVTSAFDIELGDKSFVIRCRDKTMQEVLETLYPEEDVTIYAKDVDSTAHFKLVVTAGDGSQSVSLTFRCLMGVKDIEIDPPSLLI